VILIVGPDHEGYKKDLIKIINELNINENVKFIGNLKREDINKAYVDSDIFVLPSYSENFGLTIIESLACGCPAVITRNVNISNEMNENSLADVVNCEPFEIGQAIINYHQKSDVEKSRHKNYIRDYVIHNYDWKKSAKKFVKLYKDLIPLSNYK
jgi:glycosyltransferase involved in cell wall biosynthesis